MQEGYVLETILSFYLNMFCRSLKCVPAIGRKDLVSASMTSIFCVLWIAGAVVGELWQRSARSHIHGFNCSRT